MTPTVPGDLWRNLKSLLRESLHPEGFIILLPKGRSAKNRWIAVLMSESPGQPDLDLSFLDKDGHALARLRVSSDGSWTLQVRSDDERPALRLP